MTATSAVGAAPSLAGVGPEARARRRAMQRTGRRRAFGLSLTIGAFWLSAVTVTGQWGRVADNGAAALTMIPGSFVAGSTPQGGGAVAFPVFTKLLGVAAADARTFSLAIQAVGMGTASAAIAITGRAIDRSALRLTVPAAIVGYLAGATLFTVVTPPGAYVKVVFTLVVAAAGACTWASRRPVFVEHLSAAPLDGRRAVIAVVAGLGGVASALFGSGADVAVYLLLSIVLGVRPSIGVATSVVTMASVSLVGLVRALLVGDLVPTVTSTGVDVFGMWLAAVPVVIVGAPLGSWFAARVPARWLARFIAVLAGAEVASTVLFLDELRSDPILASFAAIGLVATLWLVRHLLTVRDDLACRRPALASVRRLDLEVTGAP
ncbi:MAG: sulfite exporter TauE/SafE family protein [Actinomycetota bacterium]